MAHRLDRTHIQDIKTHEHEQNIHASDYIFDKLQALCCHVLYLSSLRQGATAVRSAAAIHHPVARLKQTQAQRPPQVPSPEDTQQLWQRGSCCTQRMQRHTLWLHLPLYFHVYRLSLNCSSSLLYTAVEYDL